MTRIKRKLEQMMGNELIPALLVRSIFFDSGRIIIFRIIFNSKQNLQEKKTFFERTGYSAIVLFHAECNTDVRLNLT